MVTGEMTCLKFLTTTSVKLTVELTSEEVLALKVISRLLLNRAVSLERLNLCKLPLPEVEFSE